jgi:hypothetical protein
MKLVAEQTGNPVILYGRDGLRPDDPFIPRLPLLAPLLEAQDYIEAVLPWNGETIDHDASHFRVKGYPFGVTLAALQANYLHLLPDFSQRWIKVEPMEVMNGKIAVARSGRYNNHHFPWSQLVNKYRGDMVFLGLEHEYAAFCREFGGIDWLRTTDLKEVAEAIAGSVLFIGNQSSPNALAEGLKHPLLQETCLWCPDCIYPRANAIHCHDGGIDTEILGHRFKSPPFRQVAKAHVGETPPNGWRIRLLGLHVTSYSFDVVLGTIRSELARRNHPEPSNLRAMIIEQSSAEMPPPPPMAPIEAINRLLQK